MFQIYIIKIEFMWYHIIQYQWHPTWINDNKIYHKTPKTGNVMYEMIQFYMM